MSAKCPKPKRPEKSGYEQDLWYFWGRYEDKKAERAEWEEVQAPTATDKALKEARLAELDADLAKLDEEYQRLVRRGQDGGQPVSLFEQDYFTLAELAARWNMTEAEVFSYVNSGELSTVVRPDAPDTLDDFPLDQLEEASGRILLVSREGRDRFEKAHGIKVQQRPFTCGTLEEAANALAHQQGMSKAVRDDLLKDMIAEAENGKMKLWDHRKNMLYASSPKPVDVRCFWHRVRAEELNDWLASRDAAYRLGADSEVPVPATKGGEQGATDNWLNDGVLTKGEKQKRAILAVIALKGWDRMKIPSGGKKAIDKDCYEMYKSLFDKESSFKDAWKAGRGSDSWKMEHHASFAKGCKVKAES